jgi:hypothetical protein
MVDGQIAAEAEFAAMIDTTSKTAE